MSDNKDKNQWEQINITSGINTAPAADTALVSHAFTHEAIIEAIEIGGEEANFFKVMENSTVIGPGPLRLKSDGQLIYKETFENPITTIQAGKTLAIKNVDAGSAGARYSVSVKVWTRRG